jgi:hypothetical protein
MSPDPNTPIAALKAHDEFKQAVRECERIIQRAYSSEISQTRWAAAKQEWDIWRRDAEAHVGTCNARGYPEYGVTDALQKQRSLDDKFKIACDYRNNDAKSQAAEAPSTRHSPQTEKALERLINYHGEKPLEGMKKKELAHLCGVSRNTAVKALKEFKKQSGQLTVKIDK